MWINCSVYSYTQVVVNLQLFDFMAMTTNWYIWLQLLCIWQCECFPACCTTISDPAPSSANIPSCTSNLVLEHLPWIHLHIRNFSSTPPPPRNLLRGNSLSSTQPAKERSLISTQKWWKLKSNIQRRKDGGGWWWLYQPQLMTWMIHN